MGQGPEAEPDRDVWRSLLAGGGLVTGEGSEVPVGGPEDGRRGLPHSVDAEDLNLVAVAVSMLGSVLVPILIERDACRASRPTTRSISLRASRRRAPGPDPRAAKCRTTPTTTQRAMTTTTTTDGIKRTISAGLLLRRDPHRTGPRDLFSRHDHIGRDAELEEPRLAGASSGSRRQSARRTAGSRGGRCRGARARSRSGSITRRWPSGPRRGSWRAAGACHRDPSRRILSSAVMRERGTGVVVVAMIKSPLPEAYRYRNHKSSGLLDRAPEERPVPVRAVLGWGPPVQMPRVDTGRVPARDRVTGLEPRPVVPRGPRRRETRPDGSHRRP